MAAALAAAGADVTWALYHGGHDWQLWHAHLDQMLILASRDTTVPPPACARRGTVADPGRRPDPQRRGSPSPSRDRASRTT